MGRKQILFMALLGLFKHPPVYRVFASRPMLDAFNYDLAGATELRTKKTNIPPRVVAEFS